MYNIWVPVADVQSEPLLLFAANPTVADAVDWRACQEKAHHLPQSAAHDGVWYYFPNLRCGQAVVFPGDGGGHRNGQPGVFHCSAWASSLTRQSFDVRELLVPLAVHWRRQRMMRPLKPFMNSLRERFESGKLA